MSQSVSITIMVNEKEYSRNVEPRLLLSDFLRHELGLTGTHVGCEHGVCGACTVLFDGESMRSCLIFAVQADGHSIMTVEGLATSSPLYGGTEGGGLHPLQQSFWEAHGLQCGYCTPGILMSMIPFLKQNPNPTEDDIRHALSGNLCRCTGYQHIVDAVKLAAEKMKYSTMGMRRMNPHSLKYRSLLDNLASGVLTLPEFLSQVEARFTENEPSVLSFIPEEDRFTRLHDEADALGISYPDPHKRPPLFGALVGVKDIFHTEGFTTQAGSRLPAEILQGREAESVMRLKNAGALVLGKTVTTEFAYFSPGPTRNPHNLEHTPGGSSSGSAAAVASGFCHLALGTQTIGSIIRPAAFCGVVGFKPTYDRISRDGVIPLSPTLDHIGFFTPDIETAKWVASVLIGDWRLDTVSQKPTLGIPEGLYLACASDYALTCFNAICDSLTQAGYDLRRLRVMDDFQAVRDRHDVIMSYDTAIVHKEWFIKHEALYSQKFVDLIRRGQKITNSQLQDALNARDQFRDSITQTMTDNNIDIWICPPTIGPAPKGLDATGDPVMCLPWTQIGFPALNIPTTKNEEGLPMGLQLVGTWNSDESLFAWGEEIEKVVRTI